jgi:hypothetical protein
MGCGQSRASKIQTPADKIETYRQIANITFYILTKKKDPTYSISNSEYELFRKGFPFIMKTFTLSKEVNKSLYPFDNSWQWNNRRALLEKLNNKANKKLEASKKVLPQGGSKEDETPAPCPLSVQLIVDGVFKSFKRAEYRNYEDVFSVNQKQKDDIPVFVNRETIIGYIPKEVYDLLLPNFSSKRTSQSTTEKRKSVLSSSPSLSPKTVRNSRSSSSTPVVTESRITRRTKNSKE